MTATVTDASARPRLPPNALRSAVVFAVGTAFQRGLSFVLLPLYTRAISPADYGALGILLALSTAAGYLFALGLDLAIYRTYFQLADEPRHQREFIDSIWRFLAVIPVVMALLLGALAWPVLAQIPRLGGLNGLLAFLAAAFWVSSTTVPYAVVRVQQRLKSFMVLTIFSGTVSTIFTVLAVVVIHGSTTGWLVAAVAANASCLVAAMVIVPWNRRGGFRAGYVTKAVRFGVSVLPHTLAFWALLLADRLILAGLVSARELGVYSLGANLALPVMIAVQSLNQGLMPAYAKAGADRSEHSSLESVVVLQVVAVMMLTLGATLLAAPLVALLAAPSYSGAAPIVAWTALAYGLLGLYYIPMNGATLGAGRTRRVWIRTLLSAGANIALLYVVVPIGGILYAAMASAAGYLVLLVAIAVYSRVPGNPVRYPWRRLLVAGGFAVIVYAAASVMTPTLGALAIALRIAAMGLYAVILVVARVVDLGSLGFGRVRVA